MDRIEKLCRYLDYCTTFADVGCDHGYCTWYMLENGMCESAVISDISAQSLNKAENLLKSYIQKGVVTSVCADGLEGVNKDVNQVLIAGMGGEEIISILEKSFIPENFVLQPMKNVRAVREFLLEKGAAISVDEPFEFGGKFYYVIKGKNRGKSSIYGGQQLDFGLNLSGETTRAYILTELKKKLSYLERNLNEDVRCRFEAEVRQMKEVLKNESGRGL